MTATQPICHLCGDEGVLRRRPPKIISYLLFIGSFVVFLIVTTYVSLTVQIKIMWLFIQFMLGAWTVVDRKNNSKLLFYCRKCRSRIPS